MDSSQPLTNRVKDARSACLFCLMKVSLICLALLTVACHKVNQSKTNLAIERELQIKDLKLNDIVHDTLSEEQLANIKRIHSAFSEVTKSSLEETIDNFKRDRNPDREIAIWLKMATAYEQFAVNKHIEEYDKKQEAFELLLFRSMATEQEVLEKYRYNYLSKDEVREIFSYYAEPPHRVTIEHR